MLVTPSGMLISVKSLQSEYIDIFDYQLFVVNTVEKWSDFLLRLN